jgi:hypothetical protein
MGGAPIDIRRKESLRTGRSEEFARVCFWSGLSRSKPNSEVSDVPPDVSKLVWLRFYATARRLNHETGAATIDIPVVVDEVMKTGFSHCPAQTVPEFIATSLKRHNQVKRTAGYLTLADRNYPSLSFRLGRSHCAFVGVSREKLDQARRRRRIAHQLVNGFDWSDSLIVAIAARMVIRPGDRRCVFIVSRTSRLIGVLVRRVEKMRRADPANRADRCAQILMIASQQDSAASLTKPSDAFAVFLGKAVAEIDGKEPQFIAILNVQLTQDWIVAGSIWLPISHPHVDPISIGVLNRAEMFAQQQKAVNRPVIFAVRN